MAVKALFLLGINYFEEYIHWNWPNYLSNNYCDQNVSVSSNPREWIWGQQLHAVKRRRCFCSGSVSGFTDTPAAWEDLFPYQIMLPMTTERLMSIAGFQFSFVARPQIKQQQHYLTFSLDLKLLLIGYCSPSLISSEGCIRGLVCRLRRTPVSTPTPINEQ